MDKSYVNLLMIQTFHATAKSHTDSKEVSRITLPSIPAHSEDVWSGETLIIPPLPPSFLEGCKIIDIKYILKLNVVPFGPSRDLEIPLELIIGTIPLKSVIERNPPRSPPPIAFDTHYVSVGHNAQCSCTRYFLCPATWQSTQFSSSRLH